MNIRSHENGFWANIPSLESLADSLWREMPSALGSPRTAEAPLFVPLTGAVFMGLHPPRAGELSLVGLASSTWRGAWP